MTNTARLDIGPSYEPSTRTTHSSSDARVILVSNRLPVTVAATDEGVEVRRSVGGLAAGLRVAHERPASTWVGWPGDLGRIEPAARRVIERRFSAMKIVWPGSQWPTHWPLEHSKLSPGTIIHSIRSKSPLSPEHASVAAHHSR